jgi:hypothetical protein
MRKTGAFIRFGIALMVLLAMAMVLPGATAPAAAEGIEVRSQAVQNAFPDGLRIRIFLASTADITNTRLRYRALPDGNLVTVQPTCSPATGTVVDCTAIVGRGNQSYLAPGKEVEYYWEVEDAAGQKLSTGQDKTVYNDTRFQWQGLSDGNVTAYFYFGDEQTNRAVLRTARETIDRFSQLLNTTVDNQIKIWVYQSTRDLSAAAQGGRRSDNVHLGQLAADDTVLASRDVDFLNVIRHEVTHAVTARATRGHIVDIPIWINEGLSTYAQTRLLQGEAEALDLAIRRQRVLPITGLTSSARDTSDTVSLFYAQSGSIVNYLIESQGAGKFGQFIAAMRDDTMDGALKKVYGFDQFGLEDNWRRSLGLPPVSSSGSGGSGSNPGGAIPAIVPFGAQGSSGPAATPVSGTQGTQETQQADDDGSGSSSLPIIAAIAGIGLVAVGAGFYALRMRRPKAPAEP